NELVFDVLKIDRAFVVNLPAPKAVAIVKAIIAVAESLGKEVVAEGVETESQWSHLVALGCDYGQGYLFSKPLAHDELVAFARNAQASGSAAPGGRRVDPADQRAGALSLPANSAK
ncbi:MAG: EAL domain-containing protein, partial [Lysobacterales bacterium]